MDDLEINDKIRLNNLRKPRTNVRHQDLQRCDSSSEFRSVCPICSHYGLFMQREYKIPHFISQEDMCLHCAHVFYYTDIKPDILLRYETD